MNDDDQKLVLAQIRGVIYSLPENERGKVEMAVAELRGLVERHGVHGTLALALVGAEHSAEG